MDKGKADTLTVFLDQLHEAENVLKYTLQLPQASSDAIKLAELPSSDMDKDAWLEFGNESKDSIKTAAKATYENCEYLFNNGNPNLYGYKSSTARDLSILSIHTPFWRHAFIQDMVLSAFVKLRKLIGESIDMASYRFVQYSNYANDSEVPSLFGKRYHGLDYLTGCASAVSDTYMRLKSIGGKTFELEQVLLPSIPSGDIPPYASNCRRQFMTLYKKLELFNKNNRYFKPSENETEMSKVSLDVFEFCEFAIFQRRDDGSKNILPIINSYREGRALSVSGYEKYIECICNLHLQNRIEAIDKNIKYKVLKPVMEHNMSLSDKIYLRYQIEDIFSPVMIDCIYRNIFPTVATSFSMDDQATINLLSSCLTLPNVFTRQYIFQMGMDTIIKHPDYDFGASDFFSQYQIDTRAIVISARTKTNYLRRQMNLSIFLNQYVNFVNYLGHMLLPVYENYFLILLWNSVRNTFPEKSEGGSILYLYKLLRHLLNDKDFVEELFSTEDVILNATPKFHKLEPAHILHPSFSASQDIDLHLYKRCLLSKNITAEQEPVPSFLNLEYLNSLAIEPSKYVQSYFIRSFNTMQ